MTTIVIQCQAMTVTHFFLLTKKIFQLPVLDFDEGGIVQKFCHENHKNNNMGGTIMNRSLQILVLLILDHVQENVTYALLLLLSY